MTGPVACRTGPTHGHRTGFVSSPPLPSSTLHQSLPPLPLTQTHFHTYLGCCLAGQQQQQLPGYIIFCHWLVSKLSHTHRCKGRTKDWAKKKGKEKRPLLFTFCDNSTDVGSYTLLVVSSLSWGKCCACYIIVLILSLTRCLLLKWISRELWIIWNLQWNKRQTPKLVFWWMPQNLQIQDL